MIKIKNEYYIFFQCFEMLSYMETFKKENVMVTLIS